MSESLHKREWELPAGSQVKIGGLPYRLLAAASVSGFREPQWLRPSAVIDSASTETEVPEEQLLAFSGFQKTLEDYFQTFENGKRLYYERRSRQYESALGIEKTRVVARSDLIRAFGAMFLELPHRTTRGYAEFLEEIGKKIFGPEHRPEPYYLVAFALYRLDFLFRNPPISARKAIGLATKMKDSLVKDDQRCKWLLVSLELRPTRSEKWVWIARYLPIFQFGYVASAKIPTAENLAIVVMMDGTVIKPKVSDWTVPNDGEPRKEEAAEGQEMSDESP